MLPILRDKVTTQGTAVLWPARLVGVPVRLDHDTGPDRAKRGRDVLRTGPLGTFRRVEEACQHKPCSARPEGCQSTPGSGSVMDGMDLVDKPGRRDPGFCSSSLIRIRSIRLIRG